jgi:hypothetical protein
MAFEERSWLIASTILTCFVSRDDRYSGMILSMCDALYAVRQYNTEDRWMNRNSRTFIRTELLGVASWTSSWKLGIKAFCRL